MADIEVKGLVRYQGDRFSVELARGQRGGYGWTIKVRGDYEFTVLAKLAELDEALRSKFGQNHPE